MSGAPRRALVAGAGGFIGRRVVERLSAAGCAVAALPRNASLSSVAPADVVVNCAAAGVRGPVDVATLDRVNRHLPLALVAAATRWGPARVVHLGSCFEFGPPPDHRAALPDDFPVAPWSAYGHSKARGTAAVLAAGAAQGVPVVVLRPFMTYGPGERAERLVPAVLAALRAGTPVDLSAGTQQRDWIHVDDCADAVVAAALADAIPPGPFNLCTGVATTVRAVAEQLADVLGADRSLLRFGARPLRGDEPAWLVGNPRELAAALGWRARISLRDGLHGIAAAGA